ncbi:MAG: hypothetical protein PVF43_04000 [Candidatus Eiseniibacteriota bacterium]|jgi:hypothetical protein
MPVPRDHAIANHIRTILYRHWVDVAHLDFGSVNGVVYVRGELERTPGYPASRRAEEPDRDTLVQLLERDLRAIPGVKDVSFVLQGLEHGGDHWDDQPIRTA